MSRADQTLIYRGYWISVFIEELAERFESAYRFYAGHDHRDDWFDTPATAC